MVSFQSAKLCREDIVGDVPEGCPMGCLQPASSGHPHMVLYLTRRESKGVSYQYREDVPHIHPQNVHPDDVIIYSYKKDQGMSPTNLLMMSQTDLLKTSLFVLIIKECFRAKVVYKPKQTDDAEGKNINYFS